MSMTKEDRLKKREWYLKDGLIINLPELELQGVVKDDHTRNKYYLTLFRGTAGKPFIHSYYHSSARRDKYLEEVIKNQKTSLEYKAKRKAENKGNLSSAAATAKVIRERLKKEFPDIKFSVRSENFSMGNAVRISWTDGPMSEQVEQITDQYEYGRFDGQTDYAYFVKLDTGTLGCPGAKYVSCSRELTPEYRAKIDEILERDFVPREWNGYSPYQEKEAEKILLGITEPEPELEPDFEPSVSPADVETVEPSVSEPEKPAEKDNIIDFTSRLKAKQEQEEVAQEIDKFRKDYLPFFNEDDKELFLKADGEEQRAAALTLICMRIDSERTKRRG